ncbi:MAG: cyclodeaminase/cyclohydrolase family protein [Candidatus Dormibacteraeota bacterium]|nr:cyclodeaminase/cyclohydrolase family protein [Candidatus Dormibacteraeota bacterium]
MAEQPLDLGRLLDRLAGPEPVPAGGSLAAAAVAAAAALLVKVGLKSREHWPQAEAYAARAVLLRSAAEITVEADEAAYKALLEAWRQARGLEDAARERLVTPARDRTIDAPLSVARAGAEVTELAVALAIEGNPRLRRDALMAGTIAAAAARGAADLVAANVPRADDTRAREARALARAATARVARADAAR